MGIRTVMITGDNRVTAAVIAAGGRRGRLPRRGDADNPLKQELHPQLMATAKIVCDVLEQCAVMGDLHHALTAGVVRREDVHAELVRL